MWPYANSGLKGNKTYYGISHLFDDKSDLVTDSWADLGRITVLVVLPRGQPASRQACGRYHAVSHPASMMVGLTMRLALAERLGKPEREIF